MSNPGCFRLLPVLEHEVAGSAARCQDRDHHHLCQSAVAGQGRGRYHLQVEEARRQWLSCLRLRIGPYFPQEDDLYLETSLILLCWPEDRRVVESLALSDAHSDSVYEVDGLLCRTIDILPRPQYGLCAIWASEVLLRNRDTTT